VFSVSGASSLAYVDILVAFCQRRSARNTKHYTLNTIHDYRPEKPMPKYNQMPNGILSRLTSHFSPLKNSRRSLCRLSGRKVRTTQSTAPSNRRSSSEGKGIESVTENYRLAPVFRHKVRVKTCGKSARLLQATATGDKPCGLKCHVHLVNARLAQFWLVSGRVESKGGRQRRSRLVRDQINDRGFAQVKHRIRLIDLRFFLEVRGER